MDSPPISAAGLLGPDLVFTATQHLLAMLSKPLISTHNSRRDRKQGQKMGKREIGNHQNECNRVSEPGAFKLEHLQPFKLIVF